jgi:hypothetical protein
MSKTELYDRAKRHDNPRRSSMSKRDHILAIRQSA